MNRYLQLLSLITQDIYHKEEEEESSTAQPDYVGHNTQRRERGIVNRSARLCRTYITEKRKRYRHFILSRIIRGLNPFRNSGSYKSTYLLSAINSSSDGWVTCSVFYSYTRLWGKFSFLAIVSDPWSMSRALYQLFTPLPPHHELVGLLVSSMVYIHQSLCKWK